MATQSPMSDGVEPTRAIVRRFITDNFYVGSSQPLADDTSLADAGVVDSTGVLEVIDFVQRRFGIVLADAELVPDNLDSIAGIAAFVERRRGA